MTHHTAHVRPQVVHGPLTAFLLALGLLGCVLFVVTDQALRWERLYLVTAISGIVGACTNIIVRELHKTRNHSSEMRDDSLLATAAMAEQVIAKVMERLAPEPEHPSRPLALVDNTQANGITVLPVHGRRTGTP